MAPIDILYLNGPASEALALTDDAILAAVAGGLRAQGLGQTVIDPRTGASRTIVDASSLTDMRTGAMLDTAQRLGLGQTLRFQ